MLIKHTNLWTSTADIILVTTNAVVIHGRLIMGRGAALEAKIRYRGCDKAFGSVIESLPRDKPYGVILACDYIPTIGAFQVKWHYAAPAQLQLIEHSTAVLCELATRLPTSHFAMNFPGIGAGGLSRDVILPIISILPDNVEIHELS